MLTLLTIIGAIALVGICSWIIFLILMQKPNSNASMGASLGGGIAEAAFGGEASRVLTRLTVYGIIGFFVCTLSLSLAHIYRYHHRQVEAELKPIDETPLQSLTQLPNHPANVAASPTTKADTNSKTQDPAAVNKDEKAVNPATSPTIDSRSKSNPPQSHQSKAKAQP